MTEPQSSPDEYARLVSFLRETRGFELTAYKTSTLQRRILKRMEATEAPTFSDYLDFIEVHPDELRLFFDTILINVTSFFRDPEIWSYLASDILPNLVAEKLDRSPIRLWVAGCASGEEAYSLAILVCEAVGRSHFRDHIKIYATDVDEDSLAASRLAVYREIDVKSIPQPFVEKYFERSDGKFIFDRELRRSVIFGRHDLVQDAPISRIDLLTCRNTLMYFNGDVQKRVLSRFHYALSPGGVLVMGKAETLLGHTDLFSPINLKHRIFCKLTNQEIPIRSTPKVSEVPRSENLNHTRLRDATFEHGLWAQIVLDSNQRLSLANSKARTLFGISHRDIGRLFQDLELSHRPVELQNTIEQAVAQRRSIVHKEGTWTLPGGVVIMLEIQVSPIATDPNSLVGVCITFEDVTHYRRLQSELQNLNQGLETAYEEVQSTNEELQTTNEELQSTVEELETTNEGLQSANEELETLNEEFMSSNEELKNINDELVSRSEELGKAKAFLESILVSLNESVIVLDHEFHVMEWNNSSEALWGLRVNEVSGKHFLNLDIGLPVEQLKPAIRTCLGTGEPQQMDLEAINRRGRKIACKILCTPLRDGTGTTTGVIILTKSSGD